MSKLSESPMFMLSAMGDFGYVSYKSSVEGNEYKLLSKQPKDWKDLQYIVYILFKQLGYLTHLEKKIDSVRSTIEIDVFAEKNVGKFEYEKIIVECKYWNQNIPQEVVHSVRTVAEDTGANKAYIIAKKGFQSGAVKAATNSVVKLYSFDDFIESISESWLKRFKQDYYQKIRALKKYIFLNEMLCWNVGTAEGFKTEADRDRYLEISDRYYFLFYHLKFLEQDIKIDLETYPEQYKSHISTNETFLTSMPLIVKINDNSYVMDSMVNLYQIIFEENIVDMLLNEIELFMNDCNKAV